MRWEDDGAWCGELTTRNTGEFPNAVVVSRLSQILEETPHPKYNLTAKACQGILRRAERRGKDLPKLLKAVLLSQSASGGGCDGGGKGALVQTDKSGTLGTGNDQTIFAPTAYSFDSLSSNSMKSKNPHSGCREVDVAKTLDTTDPTPSKNQGGIAVVAPAVALDMTHACDVIRECGEQAPSLQARMGTDGNQVPLTYQDVTGTLSPGAHAGSYNGQDAYNDMLVCGASPDVAHALRAKAVEKVCQAVIDKKVKTPDDVAVVVRCKDCKHSWEDLGGLTCSHGVCVDCNVLGDFYCSYGERKDGADAEG